MKVNSIRYVIAMGNVDMGDRIRRRKVEDALPDIDFSYIGTPAGLPIDIPRMIGNTRDAQTHAKAQIQLSNTAVNMAVFFDEDYQNNRDLCLESFYEVAGSLDSIVRQVAGPGNVRHIGVIAQYIDDEVEAPQEKLRDKMMPIHFNDREIFDLEGRFALSVPESYFVNVTFSVLHTHPEDDGDIKDALGLVVDINDRYGYEYQQKLSRSENLADIRQLHDKAFACLPVLLEKGEFNIDA